MDLPLLITSHTADSRLPNAPVAGARVGRWPLGLAPYDDDQSHDPLLAHWSAERLSPGLVAHNRQKRSKRCIPGRKKCRAWPDPWIDIVNHLSIYRI